ncbi:tetraacyldisaccharide 4'-kinase [Zunongwangia sp. H14]|uniref:tetraacyldisaccharide 4'-kinase n=1 Tax=Zunongwangia sp. H14 TaxID=3240792 RepID=UPI0035678AB1
MLILRKLLFPFALLYGAITWFRNFLYNTGVLKSREYDLPVICVGNLNTGGTGKSPMIEFLLKILLPEYRVATLSRGYKRNSKGYVFLSGRESAAIVGDEPLQFKRKYPDALVAVDANRQNGISCLAEENPEVILLDDAFQHRKVKAGLNILLTAYDKLFINDVMLPTGNLREPAAGAERAAIIVVTKCPPDLGIDEMQRIRTALKPRNYQRLFFSYISYGEEIFGNGNARTLQVLAKVNFTLITGIANPVPLVEFLKERKFVFRHLQFPDHHQFSSAEIKKIASRDFILATEKDYMRLKEHIPAEQLWYLPINTKFITGEEAFKREIREFIKTK